MWTSTLDLDPKRVLVTQLLGRFWRGACFSSFAPLQVKNLPRQTLPATTWVRVRNRVAGICGSDLQMIQADGDFRIAPATIPQQRHSYPGHEVVGEVLEIGADVQQLHIGDRVVLQYGSNCLAAGVQPPCRSCAQGNYNLCECGKLPGPHPIGGGWSEEMLLHEQQLFRIPTDISDDQAVLLEPASVAVHAVLRRLPRQGDRVLIMGAGTIGLLTLQVVRALVPQAEVSVLARYPFQIEQATRLGAAHIIYPQDSYTGIQRATDAQLYEGVLGNRMLLGGYDVIYDTVGSQKTLHHALRWARAQSTVVLVGLSLHMMHIDLTPIWYREVNLLGSLSTGIEIWPIGTNEQRSTFEVTAELIKRRQIHPEHLITHRFPLTSYQAAMMTAVEKAQSRAIKVVFDYSLLPASVVPNVRASATRLRRPASNISPLDDQDTPEEVLYPIEALASSVSVKPPTSIALSSDTPPTASPQVDDEFDELEDTVKAPIVNRHTGPVQADTNTDTQQANEPENIQTMPTVPAKVADPAPPVSDIEESSIQSVTPLQEARQLDESPTSHQDTKSNEPAADTHAQVESYEEAIQNLQESADSSLETIQATHEATEQLDVVAQEASEPFVIPVTETTQDTSEQPVITVWNTSEPSEPPAVDIEVQAIPELPEQQPPVSVPYTLEEPEQTATTTMQSPSEHPESSTMIAQNESAAPDPVKEEETGEVIATNDTENALLQVEEPHAVPLQPRPRGRARKKSGRTTQRGSK